MSYDNTGYNYHSKIVNTDESEYLIQGSLDDEIVMIRDIDKLLECERNNVNQLVYFKDLLREGGGE